MRTLPRLRIGWLCALLAASALVVNLVADEMKVKLTLLWGTDEDKPADQKLKPANSQMVSQFREVCKWKNYFEVTNTMATISQNATNRIRLSPKCEIELGNLGKMGLAAKFYGEGKLIYNGKKIPEAGKIWSIGGQDKNATAWFVVLTPQ